MGFSSYLSKMKKIRTQKLPVVFTIMTLVMLFLACRSTQPASDEESSVAYQELLTLVETQAFRIDVDAVRPYNTAATTQVLNNLMTNTGNTAGRINVTGDGHYVEVRDGMVKGSLPYFGEQRQGGSVYGRANVGIEFEGSPKDYEVVPNKNKNRVVIKFVADDSHKGTEFYDVILTALPGGSADIRITSSQRSTIAYMGTISKVAEKM